MPPKTGTRSSGSKKAQTQTKKQSSKTGGSQANESLSSSVTPSNPFPYFDALLIFLEGRSASTTTRFNLVSNYCDKFDELFNSRAKGLVDVCLPTENTDKLFDTIEERGLWGQFHKRTYVIVAKLFLRSEYCLAQEKGLNKLRETFFKDTVTKPNGMSLLQPAACELIPLFHNILIDEDKSARIRRLTAHFLAGLTAGNSQAKILLTEIIAKHEATYGNVITNHPDYVMKVMYSLVVTQVLAVLNEEDERKRRLQVFFPHFSQNSVDGDGDYDDILESFPDCQWENNINHWLKQFIVFLSHFLSKEVEPNQWLPPSFFPLQIAVNNMRQTKKSPTALASFSKEGYLTLCYCSNNLDFTYIDIKLCNIRTVTEENTGESLDSGQELLKCLSLDLIDFEKTGSRLLVDWENYYSSDKLLVILTCFEVDCPDIKDDINRLRDKHRALLRGQNRDDLEETSNEVQFSQQVNTSTESKQKFLARVAKNPDNYLEASMGISTDTEMTVPAGVITSQPVKLKYSNIKLHMESHQKEEARKSRSLSNSRTRALEKLPVATEVQFARADELLSTKSKSRTSAIIPREAAKMKDRMRNSEGNLSSPQKPPAPKSKLPTITLPGSRQGSVYDFGTEDESGDDMPLNGKARKPPSKSKKAIKAATPKATKSALKTGAKGSSKQGPQKSVKVIDNRRTTLPGPSAEVKAHPRKSALKASTKAQKILEEEDEESADDADEITSMSTKSQKSKQLLPKPTPVRRPETKSPLTIEKLVRKPQVVEFNKTKGPLNQGHTIFNRKEPAREGTPETETSENEADFVLNLDKEGTPSPSPKFGVGVEGSESDHDIPMMVMMETSDDKHDDSPKAVIEDISISLHTYDMAPDSSRAFLRGATNHPENDLQAVSKAANLKAEHKAAPENSPLKKGPPPAVDRQAFANIQGAPVRLHSGASEVNEPKGVVTGNTTGALGHIITEVDPSTALLRQIAQAVSVVVLPQQLTSEVNAKAKVDSLIPPAIAAMGQPQTSPIPDQVASKNPLQLTILPPGGDLAKNPTVSEMPTKELEMAETPKNVLATSTPAITASTRNIHRIPGESKLKFSEPLSKGLTAKVVKEAHDHSPKKHDEVFLKTLRKLSNGFFADDPTLGNIQMRGAIDLGQRVADPDITLVNDGSDDGYDNMNHSALKVAKNTVPQHHLETSTVLNEISKYWIKYLSSSEDKVDVVCNDYGGEIEKFSGELYAKAEDGLRNALDDLGKLNLRSFGVHADTANELKDLTEKHSCSTVMKRFQNAQDKASKVVMAALEKLK